MRFTTEQICKWLSQQESIGDALYFLSEQSIIDANQEEKEEEDLSEIDNEIEFPFNISDIDQI